ncbi:MAG: hypothetical protein ABSG48_10030, partial [Geobacteraceae bacterium]
MSTTPQEARRIAELMLREYSPGELLYQQRAAWLIRQEFGEQHVYRNRNGNFGINSIILAEFKRIRPADVVWSRRRQLWRKRREGDPATGIMVR